jgi:hypothetical protein
MTQQALGVGVKGKADVTVWAFVVVTTGFAEVRSIKTAAIEE